MKANTALGFILCGMSLWLLNNKQSTRQTHLIAKAYAVFAVLIAALTLGEYISNRDVGIDELFARDTSSISETSFPGRMSPVTALNLLLIGSALLLFGNRWKTWLSESLAIIVLIIAGVIVIGHIYGVSSLYQIGIYSSIALHTALAFILLCLGILCARPEHGLTSILSADDSAGVLARRLLPAAVGIPIAMGWLFLSGQSAGYYDSSFGLALFTISNVIIFAALIWRNSRILAQMEAERRKAEKALNLSEQRAHALIANSWDAIALFGVDGTILYGSPSTPQILGYTLDEFTGRNAFELIHPEDQAFVTERLNLSFQQPGKHISVYARVRHKNGQWRWLEGVFTNLLHEPSVGAIVNNYHDFTERKEAEEASKENQERFRRIVEVAPSAIIAVDRDGKIDLVNAKAQELFGYREEELLGYPVEMLVPERFRNVHAKYRQNFLAHPTSRPMGAGRNLFGVHKDGYEIPIEIGLTSYQSSQGLFTLALIVDISERKRAEEKVAYQANLLENVNDAVIGSDENTLIRFWNQGAERIFGWKAEEVLGRSAREILRSETINIERETVLKILAEQGRWRGEAALYRKDGSQVIMEVSSITLRDVNGLIAGYVSVNRDITDRKQAEAQNRFLANLVASVSDAIIAVDLQQNIQSWNAGAEAMYGWKEEEVLGRPAREILATDFLETKRETVTKQIMEQGYWAGEVLQLRRDGARIPTLSSVALYKDSADKPAGIVAVNRDITDRKQTEEEIRKLNTELEQRVVERTAALSQANSLLQMMLDHMPDQIYFKDVQSRFIRNSRSQAKALGLSDPAEAVGKSDFDFFPHAQKSFEIEQEIIQSGNPLVDQEEFVVWPDGSATWVSTTKAPLRDQNGKIIGTFGISRDITERKHTELEIQKAKLELEAANKELESFSYSVSHDLRAPLRSVDGFSQALLEDYGEILPPDGRNFLERIRSSTQRMAQLIDDLLDLSRVTRAPLKTAPVDISKLAENIATELKRQDAHRDVKFIIAQNLSASGDPRLLQIVLENLMSNAWKFTSKREVGEIEVGSRRENGETVYFIRDNGAGFDMTYVNKLFGAFQRLHAMTEFPGTGIGLATIQRIIQRHGGRVWAEGVVNQGATFFFTLPILVGAKPAPTEKEEEESIHKRAKEII